jgi:phosphate starvation-inducible protein PhoH and related proteins
VRNLFKHELAFGIGPAGTGKTYLAVAVAVQMFIDGHVDKIILSRPRSRRASGWASCPAT